VKPRTISFSHSTRRCFGSSLPDQVGRFFLAQRDLVTMATADKLWVRKRRFTSWPATTASHQNILPIQHFGGLAAWTVLNIVLPPGLPHFATPPPNPGLLTRNNTCRHCFHRIKGNAPTGRERRSPVTIRIEKSDARAVVLGLTTKSTRLFLCPFLVFLAHDIPCERTFMHGLRRAWGSLNILRICDGYTWVITSMMTTP
jgi:hypothetical protein